MLLLQAPPWPTPSTPLVWPGTSSTPSFSATLPFSSSSNLFPPYPSTVSTAPSLCEASLVSRMESSLSSPVHDRPFVCSLCFKAFKRKDHLLIHVKIHTGDKPFTCTVCGNRFAQRTHLRNHLTKHSEVRAHACAICSKRFKRKDSLRMHEKVHWTGHTSGSPDHDLKCGVCGENFPSLESGHLLFFSRPHTKQATLHDAYRPHQCSYCGRCFKRKDHKVEHERIHTGERPFKCTECGRSFVQKQQLVGHVRRRHEHVPIASACSEQFSTVETPHLMNAQYSRAGAGTGYVPDYSGSADVPFRLANRRDRKNDPEFSVGQSSMATTQPLAQLSALAFAPCGAHSPRH